MNYETENIEFKSQFTEEIYKEVMAFANTNGGTIYVGVDNNGNDIGLSDVDNEFTRITNGIRDALVPDVTIFVKSSIQENKVVKIIVNSGSNKPYYLKSKGLKPSGVYIRQGTSSVPASYEQIRAMIKESDGDVYEEMRSIHQELTFDSAKSAFSKYNLEFNKEKYRVLGIVKDNSNLYTNLAHIISDQCLHTTKVAVFENKENTIFKDSKEFKGSIFKQLEETFDYLRLCNNKKATFNGLERVEKSDYPEEAIREALLNAFVHRDYGFSGSIIINVNSEEIEFVSIGGLPFGLSSDDIKSGISQPRNRNLAEIFHRLRLIESYGTGIRKIYNHYAGFSIQPRIEITSNTFKIVLPNMNLLNKSSQEELFISPQKQKIIDYINKNGHISDKEIQDILGVGKTRAFNIEKEMCEEGLIISMGRGSNKIFKIKK